MLATVVLAALPLAAGAADPARGVRVRPVECNVLPGERGANVWERAKVPELRRYCDLVASASAKLTPGSHMVAEVVRLAEEADALVPGRAAPQVLKGRALCELAQYAEALASLRVALTRDDHALDDPIALLAWARVLLYTGDTSTAREAYRALLPRADVLSLADRGVAYLGAGMLSMARGPDSLGDTIAILRQARHESQDLLRAAATFALALALDRSGAPGEAAALLADEGAGEAPRVMSDPRVIRAMGGGGRSGLDEPAESRAIEALALEVLGKRDAARVAWQAYMATGAAGGVWAAHARARAATTPGAAQPRGR